MKLVEVLNEAVQKGPALTDAQWSWWQKRISFSVSFQPISNPKAFEKCLKTGKKYEPKAGKVTHLRFTRLDFPDRKLTADFLKIPLDVFEFQFPDLDVLFLDEVTLTANDVIPEIKANALAFAGITKIQSMKPIVKYNPHRLDFKSIQTTIECGVLSLLKIPNLREIGIMDKLSYSNDHDNQINALTIVNKHLRGDKDIPECQQELIEEGLQEYAKL